MIDLVQVMKDKLRFVQEGLELSDTCGLGINGASVRLNILGLWFG